VAHDEDNYIGKRGYVSHDGQRLSGQVTGYERKYDRGAGIFRTILTVIAPFPGRDGNTREVSEDQFERLD
jgi:hypothetical protein